MCKNFFDLEIYLLLLDKYYRGEVVEITDIEYLQDVKNIKHFYKEINRYSRDVLFKIPPYDLDTNEYFYVIYYKEKCYRISNDELNDSYIIDEVADLKIELNKLNNQEDDDVLQDVICIDSILEHNKNYACHISHIVRKRK